MLEALSNSIQNAILQIKLDPWWEATALAGELVFGGRFILQWIVSEYKKKSYVPTAFWFMSIVGSLILLIYSIHIEKPVLILAFTVNTISSLIYATVLISAGMCLGFLGSGQWSAGWAVGMCAVGILAVLSRYLTFHVTMLRSVQAFNLTARLSVLEGVLTLGVCSLDRPPTRGRTTTTR